jgi:pSer/pThr/pTyr-binding forkhead associated (FHA) protein
MPASVRLVVTAGPIRGRSYEFAAHDTFLFGRAPDCHARLAANDVSASRHHFLVEASPPRARLRDLGSLNGTHVNGVRQAEAELRHGDEIRVGATFIRVEIGDASSSPPASAPRPDAAPPADSGTARPGSRIGRYTVERELGRGGMGSVYLAHGADAAGPVALKLMLPEAQLDDAARDLFLREIEVTRALRHRNIVGVLEAGCEGGLFYLALEYCEGGSAEALRQRHGGRIPLATALRLMCDVLDGLAFAHEHGFVHRDLKPDNVLLAHDGTARLGDFGLAKSFEQAGLSGMTATGAVAGTLQFMPREQLTSFRQTRPESDVWSAAASFYYLLTGHYARDFPSEADPLAVILRGGFVPLRDRDPSLPAELAGVIDTGLADDPVRRHPDGGAFARALRAVL